MYLLRAYVGQCGADVLSVLWTQGGRRHGGGRRQGKTRIGRHRCLSQVRAARPHAPGSQYTPAGLEDGGLEVECISVNADGAGTTGMDCPKGGQSSTEQGRHDIWIAVNYGLLYVAWTNEPDATP